MICEVINCFVVGGNVYAPNNDFETGALSPWAASVGSASIVTTWTNGVDTVNPHSGTYMLSCVGGGLSVTFGQDIAVPSSYFSEVDAGSVFVSNISAWHNPGPPSGTGQNDRGRLFVSFLDVSNAVISTVYSDWNSIDSTWTQISVPPAALPANTRAIRIGAVNEAEDATHDNFWDDFSQPVLSVSTASGTFQMEDGSTFEMEDSSTFETQAI